MSKVSKAEKPVWNEFYDNCENLAYTTEKIIPEKKKGKLNR